MRLVFIESAGYFVKFFGYMLRANNYTSGVEFGNEVTNKTDIVVRSHFETGDYRHLKDHYQIFVSAEPLDCSGKDEFDLIISVTTEQRLLPAEVSSLYIPMYTLSFFERTQHSAEHLVKKDPILINKTKFCAFMYHKCHDHREGMFDWLNQYKPVDALGRCKKNVVGGVCQEVPNDRRLYTAQETYNDSAVRQYLPYKFVLAVENAMADNYISEKLINPMLAYCIPIYVGCPEVVQHFNPKSFINVNEFETMDDCLRVIQRLDNDDSAYRAMLQQPWLHNNQLTKHFLPPNSELIRDFNLLFQPTVRKPLLFDQCVTINLTRRPELWMYHVYHLKRLHWLPFHQRLEATEGQQLQTTSAWLKEKRAINPSFNMKRGQIACFDSHIRIWTSMVQRKIQRMLILEDDTDLCDALSDKLDEIHNKLQGVEYDVLYLGYRIPDRGLPSPLKPMPQLPGFLTNPDTLRQEIFTNILNDVWGTHALVLTLSGAEKLLSEPAWFYCHPVDEVMARFPGLKRLYVESQVVHSVYHGSDTEGRV